MKDENRTRVTRTAPPDFTAYFSRGVVRPLRFHARPSANHVHDIQFLSGYLHDARLTPSTVALRGKKLTISLHRDCWELPLVVREGCSELYTAKSRLTIQPVSSVRWEVDEPATLQGELWIECIYLGPAHWEEFEASEIVISAPHARWKLTIAIAGDFGDIRLRDLETPKLWAERTESV